MLLKEVGSRVGFVVSLSMMTLLMTACALRLEGVVNNGCEWVEPIYLSEASITALREAQVASPEVQQDRRNIRDHNILYERFCGE